ncbi:zinc finger Ran-binding domain-containing protein [Schleiferilactobacillus perolens]|uniref:Zinc-ribbon domain-containing protein n=1 Tax=Schleiferilactobacillus perolens DSM 12744 TaxID=1423792 RepID=A0A0R1N7S3_9LACO|nr:zinc finger Ran-binding domain-containing protein [Schleiferilactobacillus perolens]KRL13714.1 hypothetical protein FD09_GL001741 [Schleiferilactobacillus perolens DSM 12744]
MIKICTKCGYHNVVKAKFCVRCGTKLGIATDEANLISSSPTTPSANVSTPVPDNQNTADSHSTGSETDTSVPSRNTSSPDSTAKPTQESPAQPVTQPTAKSQSTLHRRKKTISWLVVLIFAIGFGLVLLLFYPGNSLPDGYSTTDDVLTLAGENSKANSDIQTYSGYGQLTAGVTGKPGDAPNTIIVMKNKDTGRFVFDYNGHPIYIIRIPVQQYSDGDYNYFSIGLGVDKDNDGDRYEKVLPKSFKQDNAEEGQRYSYDDYNVNYDVRD